MISTLILAAGKGTRMNSSLPKVLHPVGSKPSLFHVIDLAKKVSNEIILVLGYKHELIQNEVLKKYRDENIKVSLQIPQNGTAHAVRVSLNNITEQQVVILSGDVPSLKENTLRKLINFHNEKKNFVSFISAKIDDPAKYGRVIFDENNIAKEIIEFINLDNEQKHINIINSGIYIFNTDFLKKEIKNIKIDSKSKEFFLPDLIKIAYKEKKVGSVIIDNYKEIMGFNTKEQLKILNLKNI